MTAGSPRGHVQKVMYMTKYDSSVVVEPVFCTAKAKNYVMRNCKAENGGCRLHGKSYGLFIPIVRDSNLTAFIASHHSSAPRHSVCSTDFHWHRERGYDCRGLFV